MTKNKNTEAKHVDHDMFLNKDGLPNGGVEIEVTKADETQDVDVKGQRSVLAEKKRKAKWYQYVVIGN